MVELFTESEFLNAKSKDLLLCKCYRCSGSFQVRKNIISFERNHNRGRVKFCSKECFAPKTIVVCMSCDKHFSKKPGQIKKTNNNFCSRNCAAKFNNANRQPPSTETRAKTSEAMKLHYSKNIKTLKVEMITENNNSPDISTQTVYYKYIKHCNVCGKDMFFPTKTNLEKPVQMLVITRQC